MIRIAVVEDNEKSLEQIKGFIDHYMAEHQESIEIVTFTDGLFIVDGYQARYDIILMDIQMKLMDGMEAAEKIRKMDPDVILIFITNYTQYAIRGYAVKALNYVLKPIKYFDFEAVLSESIQKIKDQVETYLMIAQPGGMVRMAASDIFYIESSNHTLIYHTKRGIYETRGTLKELEERLKKNHFSRCNTCYLVNLNHVNKIEKNTVIIDGEALAISRPKKKAFLNELTCFMGGEG